MYNKMYFCYYHLGLILAAPRSFSTNSQFGDDYRPFAYVELGNKYEVKIASDSGVPYINPKPIEVTEKDQISVWNNTSKMLDLGVTLSGELLLVQAISFGWEKSISECVRQVDGSCSRSQAAGIACTDGNHNV